MNTFDWCSICRQSWENSAGKPPRNGPQWISHGSVWKLYWAGRSVRRSQWRVSDCRRCCAISDPSCRDSVVGKMTGKWIEKGKKRVSQPGLWWAPLTGDPRMVGMELEWALIVMWASEKRLSLWPSHFLWPSQGRSWRVCERSGGATSSQIKWRWSREQCQRLIQAWNVSVLPSPVVSASKHFPAQARYLFHNKHFIWWTPAGAWSWKPDSSLIGSRAVCNRLIFPYFFYYLMFVYQTWKWLLYNQNGKLWQKKKKTLLKRPQ